jgi:hypothetical protein
MENFKLTKNDPSFMSRIIQYFENKIIFIHSIQNHHFTFIKYLIYLSKLLPCSRSTKKRKDILCFGKIRLSDSAKISSMASSFSHSLISYLAP